MNRPVGPQTIRGMPGFPAQQQPQGRPIGGGRLTNGKMGSGSGWGFGIPMNAAPGLQHPQSRSNSAALTGFAQTIGGSQNATSLDPSEFPSLSGAPSQPQAHPNTQQTWGTQNQRTTHTPIQRSQQSSTNPQSSINVPSQQTQQQQDDLFPSSAQFANGLDDYRYGSGNLGQIGGSNQPQTTNIEEFPPLGRTGNGEIGQDRQGGIMQNSGAFGNQGNSSGFSQNFGQNQGLLNRTNGFNGLSGQVEGSRQGHASGGITSPIGLGSGGIASSRSPDEPSRLAHNQSIFSNVPGSSSQIGGGQASSRQISMAAQQAQQQQTRTNNSGQGLGGVDFPEPPQTTQSPDGLTLSQMNEIDKFGLKGLLGLIRHESADIGSLAVGQDLTQLGLDLNQPDNNPLYSTFASPFAGLDSRPVEPDFSIPECYDVRNVMPLQQKAASFSDETLFYIFYTMPRDIAQEIAATELTNRNWRFHKSQQKWLTKDNHQEPVRISATEERGYYIFFDPMTWSRNRREFLLQYDELDSRSMQPAITG